MARFLITGRPGTGKSTVATALAKRGYNAYDLEEVPHIVRLEIKATGEPTNWPEGFVDWNYYSWNIQAKPLEDFLASHEDKDTYVAVSGSNQRNFYPLFDKVFVLTFDDPELLRQRLETRKVHEFGQSAENIDRAVSRFQTKTQELLELGGVAIDNSRPLDTVIDDIIAKAHSDDE
jgi:broad-specificity NMP kinase